MLLVLGALVLLAIVYLFRSCPARTTPPPVPEATPIVAEATATAVAPAASPTPVAVPTVSGADVPCQDSVILIGPDAATVRPEIACVGTTNWVRWRSWDGQSPLTIYFPTSGYPEGISKNVAPFPDMSRRTAGGKDDWVFNHPQKSTTYAERPNAIGSAGRRYTFKYDQELNGVRVDGRIIIQH
jgi:hypothetical protein